MVCIPTFRWTIENNKWFKNKSRSTRNNNLAKRSNDINRTLSQCNPLNLQSHQGRQIQKHTIYQLRKEAGGAPCTSEWFGPGEWSYSVEVWAYKPLKTVIKRWHCSGNEKNKLKQQSTVNNQNTEDDLKILLRILSIKHFHNSVHYYTSSWPSNIHLDNLCLHRNTLSNSVSCYSESYLFSWKKLVYPTPTAMFFVFVNSSISTAW
jgi:hypothetical protein